MSSAPHTIRYRLLNGQRKWSRTIHGILNDPRGWAGQGFCFVPDAEDTASGMPHVFLLFLKNRRIVDEFGHDFEGMNLCHITQPGMIVINQDNWNHPPAVFLGPPELYRAYVVQHEMGHYLGKHTHRPSQPREPCDVMYQQTRGTGGSDGCVANPWVQHTGEQLVRWNPGSLYNHGVAARARGLSGGGTLQEVERQRTLRIPIWASPDRRVPTQMVRAQADMLMRVLKQRYEQMYSPQPHMAERPPGPF